METILKSFVSRRFRLSTRALGMAAILLATSSFAQSSSQTDTQTSQTDTPNPCKPTPPTPGAPSPAPHSPSCVAKPKKPDTSISLGVSSQLTIDRTENIFGFTMQGTAPSAGTLGTFRQTFSPWLGYSVNLGYARVSEHYLSPDVYNYNSNQFNVDSNMYESTISYVAHTRVNKRFSLFGDIGPGLLTFLPVHRGADAINYVPGNFASLIPSVQFRPAGLAGTGFDLHLSRRFDLRAEYRGLLYKNPDFQTGDAPYSKLLTLTSEPTISLVYHLHQPEP
jgi:hypothetical protein